MIKPTEGFILTEPIKAEERDKKTSVGIIVSKPRDDRPDLMVAKAKVLESSSKMYKKGQIVYYNYFSGNTILIPSKDALGADDRELHFIWEEDVLGVEDAGHTKSAMATEGQRILRKL